MKVLMISTDRLILRDESLVQKRMVDISSRVEELHIILFSNESHQFANTKVGENIWIHPTNSKNKFLRPWDAVRIGRNIDVDIVTTQDPFECGWVGMKFKKSKRVPLEVQLHTDMFSKGFSGPFNFARKILARLVIPKADLVRVVTSSLKREMVKRFKLMDSSVVVLPIFVDTNNFNQNTSFDLHQKYGFEKVILSVSRLEKEKNLGLAIKAFSKVLRDFPNIGYVIVGDGTEMNRLRKLVTSLGLKNNVIFAGWQSNLASFYKTADIYLQTSDFEGYGLSLVEAGLNAVPVISTPVGIANDLGKVLIANDLLSIITKLKLLIADQDFSKKNGDELRHELVSTILSRDRYYDELFDNWSCLIQKKK